MRRHRTPLYRRLVPEHRLPAEQERHPQRQGRVALPPRRRVRSATEHATSRHGHVRIDERLHTTAEDVYAVGDCAGSPHFTHIAFDDFRILRDNFAGGNRVTTGRQVPFCLFTDPELARVGLSEREARERGVAYRLAKLPMVAVLRTRTLSETRGFMKALIEPQGQGDQILGFTAFGPDAGELLPAVQVAMSAGLPYTALRDAIFTHPTMGKGLGSLFSAIK